MNGRLILAGSVALLAAGGAVGAFVLWRQSSDTHDQSNEELQSAREYMDSARSTTDRAKIQSYLTEARAHANKAGQLWEKNIYEAMLIDGEALIRLTKYSSAVEVLERALALHPDDAKAAELAAGAHHQSFLLAKRDSDLAAAFQLYEKAADLGAPPRVLLAAAQLAESANQQELADKYIDRLQAAAPNAPEVDSARALREARAARPGGGK